MFPRLFTPDFRQSDAIICVYHNSRETREEAQGAGCGAVAVGPPGGPPARWVAERPGRAQLLTNFVHELNDVWVGSPPPWFKFRQFWQNPASESRQKHSAKFLLLISEKVLQNSALLTFDTKWKIWTHFLEHILVNI